MDGCGLNPQVVLDGLVHGEALAGSEGIGCDVEVVESCDLAFNE